MLDVFPMILNDGTYIYNPYTLKEFLSSLGFDPSTVEDVFNEKLISENKNLKDICNSYEREIDGYMCAIRDMSEELEDLADKLSSGKGGTKVQYAERIKNIIKNYYE